MQFALSDPFSTPAAGATLTPPARAPRPWLRLAPPPPNIAFADLALLHRQQIHAAIAKRLGKRGGPGNFAASITVDLGPMPAQPEPFRPLPPSSEWVWNPRPHMVLATTRYRGPYKFERRIDLAVVPCSDGEATYYATPQPEEAARWAFDQYAASAPYRVVLSEFGCIDTFERWGTMRPIR